MILERFDSVIFVGDDPVKHIYTAFNVLLRENVALGGMKQWEMEDEERRKCKCENQFVREECGKFLLRSNEEVGTKDTGSKGSSPYYCNSMFTKRLLSERFSD